MEALCAKGGSIPSSLDDRTRSQLFAPGGHRGAASLPLFRVRGRAYSFAGVICRDWGVNRISQSAPENAGQTEGSIWAEAVLRLRNIVPYTEYLYSIFGCA